MTDLEMIQMLNEEATEAITDGLPDLGAMLREVAKEIEQLRANVKAIPSLCRWKRGSYDYPSRPISTAHFFETDCGEECTTPDDADPNELAWTYCPFCSGKIVVKASDV